MQICNTTQAYRNYGSGYNNNAKAFKSLASVKPDKCKIGNKVDYSLRIVMNKALDLFQSKATKRITGSIANIKLEQTRLYLEQLSEIGRLYSTDKIVDVNIEDKILEKIAKTGDSTIFIMNHSNQSEDPRMLAVLNTLLSDTYKKEGKDVFPLPRIILNEDILKTMSPTRRKAFENFGAVGIDANVTDGNKGVNIRAFLPLIKDFIQNKCNIFIFPEGKLAVRKDLDFFDRFQDGIANMVNKIVAVKKKVTVVPVGFSYGKKEQKGLNAMNIGTPIEINRIGEATTVTQGDILRNRHSCLFDFFEKNKDKDSVTITSNGIPVKQNEIPDFLKTILCENLEINSNIAKHKLNNITKNDNVLLY